MGKFKRIFHLLMIIVFGMNVDLISPQRLNLINVNKSVYLYVLFLSR